MAQPDFYELAAWLHEHDFASKLSGWLITNDCDNICRIARLDDPSSMVGQPGWPEGFTEPTFASDAEAIEHVRSQAAAGSEWHAAAIAIHNARIPMSLWFPEPDTRPKDPKAGRVRHPRYDKLLACCSAGPWRHGRHLPGFSADSQPCIYGNERHFPLAVLDADDRESRTNVIIMGAAYELCQELGRLVEAISATGLAQQLTGCEAFRLRERLNQSRALLSRLQADVEEAAQQKTPKECDE